MTSAATLLGPVQVRELAERLGVRPTKTLGQNFVIDAGTVRKIVRTAGVEAGEHVVEIGPGLGSLTLGILETGASVVAVEIDPVLAAELPTTVATFQPGAAERFSLVGQDALTVTELPGPPPVALVANLPYNVSVPVLLHFLERFDSLERVLVMVQLEVADRLAAPPGSKTYGVPSAKAAWYCRTSRAATIGRNVFWPAPNVDSALVAMERRDPPSTTASREDVFTVVDAAFAQRRKTLRATLAGLAGSGAAAAEALEAAGVDPSARGEVCDIDTFARITEEILARGGFHAPAPRASRRERERRAGDDAAAAAPADGGAAPTDGAAAPTDGAAARPATSADGASARPATSADEISATDGPAA